MYYAAKTMFYTVKYCNECNNWVFRAVHESLCKQLADTIPYLVSCGTTVLNFILTQVLQVLSTFSVHLPMPLLLYLQSGFPEDC